MLATKYSLQTMARSWTMSVSIAAGFTNRVITGQPLRLRDMNTAAAFASAVAMLAEIATRIRRLGLFGRFVNA